MKKMRILNDNSRFDKLIMFIIWAIEFLRKQKILEVVEPGYGGGNYAM